MLPHSVSALKTRQKSQVFKLYGVGENGTTVFVKRCWHETASIERIFYEEMLPKMGVPNARFYGFVEEGRDLSWLFVEDIGDMEYSNNSAEQRLAVARWLGALHSFPVNKGMESRLPDRGPVCYHERMMWARADIEASRANPTLTPDHWEILSAVISQFESIEVQWSEIVTFCARMPRTPIHGDLANKHLRIHSGANGVTFQTFAWEHAGIGLPGIDLQRFQDHWGEFEITTYWSILKESFSNLRLEDIYAMVKVGKVFQLLASIRWASKRIGGEWVEKGIAQLHSYENELTGVIREIGWEQQETSV